MFQKLLDVFIFHEIEENFKAVAKNNSYEYASNRGDFFFFFGTLIYLAGTIIPMQENQIVLGTQ